MGKLNKTAIIQLIAIFAFGCAIGVAFPSLWDLFNNQPLRGFEGFYYLISPIVTGAAAIGAIYYALKVRDGNLLIQEQVELAREGQLADRFQRAAEMLGNHAPEVRQAGIHALEEIARTDTGTTYYLPVQKVLCSFVRARSLSLSENCSNGYTGATSSEIATAIRSICCIRTPRNLKIETEFGWKPDLRGAKLTKLSETHVKLNFDDARFGMNEQNLSANFHCITLNCASFRYANLDDATLSGASFSDCDFTKAKLKRANLENMTVDEATLCTLELSSSEWITTPEENKFRIERAQLQT